jgi:hypothetical protein
MGMTAIEHEDGIALLVAIMAMLLMTALGTALLLSSSSETIIAAHFQDGLEARYAAGAMIERGLDELLAAPDWNPMIGGLAVSSWVDGPPSGSRTLGDGSTVDLTQIVNIANCQKIVPCSPSELAAVTADRPWGANNPQWRLYAYGLLRDMLTPGTIDSPYYVLLLVGNGPLATQLAVRAEAFGGHGAHAVVEVTAGRIGGPGDETDYNDESREGAAQILSWREVR